MIIHIGDILQVPSRPYAYVEVLYVGTIKKEALYIECSTKEPLSMYFDKAKVVDNICNNCIVRPTCKKIYHIRTCYMKTPYSRPGYHSRVYDWELQLVEEYMKMARQRLLFLIPKDREILLSEMHKELLKK